MKITLEAAVEQFLAGVAGEVSESTREWYGRCLSSFVAFLGPATDLAAVSAGNIRAYRTHLLTTKTAPKSSKSASQEGQTQTDERL